MPSFTQEEKDLLLSFGFNLDRDLSIFTKELYIYLKSKWHESSHHELEPLKNNNIDEFNKIIEFPGERGFAIIDDSFTGSFDDANLYKLSKTTKVFLGWFYGIHLHE